VIGLRIALEWIIKREGAAIIEGAILMGGATAAGAAAI
jgi:hypothetical protein